MTTILKLLAQVPQKPVVRALKKATTMMGGVGLAFSLSLAVPVQAKLKIEHSDQPKIQADWDHYWQQLRNTTPSMEFPYQSCFAASSQEHNVPLSLSLAVSRGESNFDPKAISKSDAIGMMQILWPGTAEHLGITDKQKLFDPCTNIDAGVRYLRQMLNRYNDNVHLTLAAYNYGPGRIKPTDTVVPDGAAWYSAYILNYLNYVVGDALHETQIAAADVTKADTAKAKRKPPKKYTDEKSLTLITFNSPEKAGAFVAHLREEVPSVRLDWFDRRLGRWSVDLLYQDEAEKDTATESLKLAGFVVPDK